MIQKLKKYVQKKLAHITKTAKLAIWHPADNQIGHLPTSNAGALVVVPVGVGVVSGSM